MELDLEVKYTQFRTRLVPYAYSIIGDSMAAEDVVQEILNKYFLNPNSLVDNPDSYLLRSVINRAINARKSIQISKKYIGHWLPVPVHTDERVYRDADKKQILDYSLLVLLERLNPKERAVFILKESFDFEHSEIAETLGTTVENSRQLYKRGREKLGSGIRKTSGNADGDAVTVRKLTDAILDADVERVKALLAADVRSVSDGGEMKAAPNIILGRDNVTKFLKAVYGKYYHPDSRITFEELNHCPAVVYRIGDVIYRCLICETKAGVIENIYIIVNPAKLRGLQDQNRIG